MVAWEDQREHDYGWGILLARFLDDPGPSFSRALHDCDWRGTTFLVSTSTLSCVACLHGGSNVTQMNLEAQTRTSDFRIAAVFRCSVFLGSGIFLLGLFLVFSAF